MQPRECVGTVSRGAGQVNENLNLVCRAETPAELWRLVREYYRALGFSGLAYFLTSRGAEGNRKGFHILHRGFTRRVSQVYIDEGLGDADPVPTLALAWGVPLRWTRTWEGIEPDAEQSLYLERIRAAELGDGYTLPVFGPAARNGCIAVGRPSNADVLETAPVGDMHIFAQAAHMRLCQLLPDTPRLERPLSARELEILDWVARGKSNGVIATILNLSGATVDTYLRRIYGKLDVSDRTSAAVRGVGMGLITA